MRVTILTHFDAGRSDFGLYMAPYTAPVIVGTSTYVGAGAILLPGTRIGDGAVVAAGAVVIQDVAEGRLVGGVPARVIKAADSKT